MANVLLVRLPYEGIYSSFHKKASMVRIFPPLGLMYLASSLEKNNHQVRILDLAVERFDYNDIEEYIKKLNPDIIGTGATTPEIQNVEELFAFIKKINPKVKTVLGGPHATILPDESILDKNTDIVVRGEGEYSIVEIVNFLKGRIKLENILGISYKKHDKIKKNPGRPPIEKLDELPVPARHLVKVKKYLWPVEGKGLIPITPILTTRGCPFPCIFCNRILGKKVRLRSPKLVVDEIEDTYNIHGITYYIMQDETFTLKKERVDEICDEIIKRRLEITWFAMVRADLVSKKIFQKMKDAGCTRITMGVESGNQKILDILKKGTKLTQYREAFHWAKEVGLETRASFILGNPYETRQTINDTINFARELEIDEAYFNIMTPYPGTEVYNMSKREEGIILLEDKWAEFKRWGNAVIRVGDLSQKDLIKFQEKAMRKFYLRPKILWRQLRRMGFKNGLKVGLKYGSILLKFFKSK